MKTAGIVALGCMAAVLLYGATGGARPQAPGNAGHPLSTREQAEEWVRNKLTGALDWFDAIDPHIADYLMQGELLSAEQKELLRRMRIEKAH